MRRSCSLSPSGTAFVLAIGAGESLVGADADSPRSPELVGLPRLASLSDAVAWSPDWVLVPELPAEGDPAAIALRAAGARFFAVAPHDLEDLFEVCRTLGPRLVGREEALSFEVSLGRPLAMIGGASFGAARPRVVALTGADPPVLAGGHSFETDVIEIAGGTSVLHPGEDWRIPLPQEAREREAEWRRLDPHLVLLTQPGGSARALPPIPGLPPGAEVVRFPIDAERFWIEDPEDVARRLRALIEPLARRLGESGGNPQTGAASAPDPRGG